MTWVATPCGRFQHVEDLLLLDTNGTVPPPLFAGLKVAVGKVIAQCQARRRHQKFLKQIDTATDPTLDVHLILDNYGEIADMPTLVQVVQLLESIVNGSPPQRSLISKGCPLIHTGDARASCVSRALLYEVSRSKRKP